MSKIMWIGFLAMLLLGPLSSSASGGTISGVTVAGNRLTAQLDLPGGVAAELSFTFEDVDNLSEASLGLTVSTLTPLDLVGRLPTGVGTTSLGSFPVLVSVAPPANGGLTFEGLATIELYTQSLHYVAGTPLRLFAAAPGGLFTDVTTAMSPGSYRVLGAKPQFYGDFAILPDLRPVDEVVGDRVYWLEALLGANSSVVDPQVFADLDRRVELISAAVDNGQTSAAIEQVEGFLEVVESYSGDGIPNLWAVGAEDANTAGDLRAVASTLLLGLQLQEASLP